MTSEVECDMHCTIKNLALKISGGGGNCPPCLPLCTALELTNFMDKIQRNLEDMVKVKLRLIVPSADQVRNPLS